MRHLAATIIAVATHEKSPLAKPHPESFKVIVHGRWSSSITELGEQSLTSHAQHITFIALSWKQKRSGHAVLAGEAKVTNY